MLVCLSVLNNGQSFFARDIMYAKNISFPRGICSLNTKQRKHCVLLNNETNEAFVKCFCFVFDKSVNISKTKKKIIQKGKCVFIFILKSLSNRSNYVEKHLPVKDNFKKMVNTPLITKTFFITSGKLSS